MRVGFVLLGGARAEKDDFRRRGNFLFDESAVRPDRRRERRDRAGETGQVLADHIDRRGAGAGDYKRRIGRLQKPRDVGAYGLGAVGGLAHAGETGAHQRRGELADRHAAEITGETRRHRRIDLGAGREKLLEPRQVAADLLRVRRAHLDAFAARDARFGDYARLAADDADSLDRTVADAFVAVLTTVFRSIYW